MKKIKWYIIAVNLVGLLVFFNFGILSKENVLKEGELVLLELAPVDPRSLIQGDYMQLRYKISETDFSYLDSISKRGYYVVTLKDNGVAEKVRIQENKEPLQKGEYLINFTYGNWNINIGAESFFFQEGEGEKYEAAKYGGLKIDREGNSVLIGLYDENLNQIK
ncbi:MAG: GDYXXLXY domain-containing protein [Flavobacteriaceae bacterium]